MGYKYQIWQQRNGSIPGNHRDLAKILKENRAFEEIGRLTYGDHGLLDAIEVISAAISQHKRIALYADYDVDGTMSCVSWIWFLEAIAYDNFVHYIPCRFKEGYGLNLNAVKHLIENEGADLIITMDTGITANEEAAYCKSRGVQFICTDHHKIQPDKMPDCVILNPKLHPEGIYQELCGCGITFVLLRKLAQEFPVPEETWVDILALTGMATICDVVPLNGVNHKLAKMGINALLKSQRTVLRELKQSCLASEQLDEKEVGFRLGPRINAVGRLQHADAVIEAFTKNNPERLIAVMSHLNEERKAIQHRIFSEACAAAQDFPNDALLFLGGDWHTGVLGIAASKLAEKFWKPVWLFNNQESLFKGSARSIPGFDVTEAMATSRELFNKFGGHKAAGGFAFAAENEPALRTALNEYAKAAKTTQPHIWQSSIPYDCELPHHLVTLELAAALDDLKPFGHGFEEPLFRIDAKIENVVFYKDKTTGEDRHTAVTIRTKDGQSKKVMYFNEVFSELTGLPQAQFLVAASKNHFRGTTSLQLTGRDWSPLDS